MLPKRLPWPLLAFNALLLPFVLRGLYLPDTDTFFQLHAGRWMWEHGAVLRHEATSYVTGQRPWVNYSWLFEVLAYASERALGLPGVALVRSLLLLVTANLLFLWTRERARGAWLPTLAFSLLGALILARRFYALRPHMVSALLLLLLVMRLHRFRESRRLLDPGILLLGVLWANLHGIHCMVALPVASLFALEGLWAGRARPGPSWRDPERRRWLLLVPTLAAAFLLNPFGPGVFAVTRGGLDWEFLYGAQETSPMNWRLVGVFTPDLDAESDVLFSYGAAFAALAVFRWLGRGEWLKAAAVGFAFALALHKVRFIAEFAVLALPLVGGELARLGRPPAGRTARVLCGALALYLAAAVAFTTHAHLRQGRYEGVAVGLLAEGPARFVRQQGWRGRLFCEGTLGGYVEWALGPEVQVFLDLRVPPFTPREFWMAKEVGRRVPYEQAAARFGIDLLLLERGLHDMRPLLADPQPAFLPVYADVKFVLFAHRRLLAGREHLALLAPDGFDPARHAAPERARRVAAEAERLLAVHDDNALAWATLVKVALHEGRVEQAHQAAARLSRRYERYATFPHLDGVALAALGRLEESAQALGEALAREPAYAEASLALSDVLARGGRYAEGRAVLEELLWRRRWDLDPGEYLLLARLRRLDGDASAAKDAYERVRWLLPESDPRHAAASQELAGLR